MNDPRYQTLIAKSAQEIDGTPETVESVKVLNSGGLIELSTFNWSGQISAASRKYLYLADVNDREIAILNHKQIHELIAFLQRAKEIMGGGA